MRPPGPSPSRRAMSTQWAASAPWETITPLGTPVEPEV
jgi:hypothetical protein